MTARIEGEYLDRDSLQSSLLREFGLAEDPRRFAPAEAGMADLMVDLYRHFQAPLTHETLWAWHRMLMAGRRDLREVGGYRTLEEPMQVVSGAIYAPRVHFEAPPAQQVSGEMDPLRRLVRPQCPDRRESAADPDACGHCPSVLRHDSQVVMQSAALLRNQAPATGPVLAVPPAPLQTQASAPTGMGNPWAWIWAGMLLGTGATVVLTLAAVVGRAFAGQ